MNKNTKLLAFLIANLGCAASAQADFSALVDSFTNPLEQQSAKAALKTYNDLKANAGCFDSMREPAAGAPNLAASNNSIPLAEAAAAPASFSCTGGTFTLFKNVRAIVHTGNELSNDGPSEYSLGLDKRGLGFALRWDANEEYSAQGSQAKNYLRGQNSSLSGRISALRMGVTGFNLHASSGDSSAAYYGGGGASGNSEEYSRWGGFIHYADGKGDKAPTDLEDAFGFNDKYVNLGVDYRLGDHWILGFMGNHIEQKVKFDGTRSVVSGYVDSKGYSVAPFAMYQRGSFYVSGAYTYQSLDFDSLRAIHYPSLNPNIPSPDTETIAKTTATTNSFFVGAGYNMDYYQLSVEPFVHFTQSDTAIDEFTEKDLKNTAFDLVVDAQDMSHSSATLGLTVRYTYTPSFAVITPYASYEFTNQHDGKRNAINSHYVNAATTTDVFNIAADPLDENFAISTFGIVSVVRGSRQSTVDGVLSGGIQVYAQYKKIINLTHYSAHMSELGVRYEF